MHIYHPIPGASKVENILFKIPGYTIMFCEPEQTSINYLVTINNSIEYGWFFNSKSES